MTLRTLHADGTLHFSDLKHIARSPQQYLASLNETHAQSRAMLRGTIGHHMILGGSPTGQKIVRFDGDSRRGKAWEAFEAANDGAIIATAPEWDEVERIVATAGWHEAVRSRTLGARKEVPIRWEENGIPCSTRGVDIVLPKTFGDLKFVRSVQPELLERQLWSMLYPQQLAFYARGLRANGFDVSGAPFLLCIETTAPFEVVDFELSADTMRVADQAVTKWLERLKVCLDMNAAPGMYSDWPGYSQAPRVLEPMAWMQDGDEEEEAEAA